MIQSLNGFLEIVFIWSKNHIRNQFPIRIHDKKRQMQPLQEIRSSSIKFYKISLAQFIRAVLYL